MSQAKSSHVFFNRSPSSKTKGSIKPVEEGMLFPP